jgi:hypothetical protein
MRVFTTFSLVVCLLFHQSGRAQAIRQKGGVVTVKGDTLFGNITMKDRITTPSEFLFISRDGHEQYFTPKQVKEFWIEEYGQYISEKVRIDTRERRWHQPLLQGHRYYRNEQVFMRRLVDGDRVGLYYYRDEEEHYYCKYNWGKPGAVYELEYAMGFDPADRDQEVVTKGYVTILHEVTSVFGIEFLNNEIAKLGFGLDAFTDIFRKLNTLYDVLHYDANNEPYRNKRASRFTFHLGVPMTRPKPMRPLDRTGLMPLKYLPGLQFAWGVYRPLTFWKERVAFRGEMDFTFNHFDVDAKDTATVNPRYGLEFGGDFIDVSVGAGISIKPFKIGRCAPVITGMARITGSIAMSENFSTGKTEDIWWDQALLKRVRPNFALRCAIPIWQEISIEGGVLFTGKMVHYMGTWYQQDQFHFGITFGVD